MRGIGLRNVLLRLVRALPAVAVVLLLGVYLNITLRYYLPLGWHHSDMDAYWLAGQRIWTGAELYVTFPAGSEDAMNYRYAPWFAYLWAPLTLLPRPIVDAVWVLLLLASALMLMLPLRFGWVGIALGLLMLPPIVLGIGAGNVQILLIAAIALTLHTRAGPAVLALAASLKGLPLLLVLVYAARREWTKVAITLGITALLVAPILLFNLSDYPAGPERATLPLWTWPFVALAAALAATRWSSRAELATAAATAALVPLHLLYNLTWLLLGCLPLRRHVDQRRVDTAEQRP